jgi:hypothetical protein
MRDLGSPLEPILQACATARGSDSLFTITHSQPTGYQQLQTFTEKRNRVKVGHVQGRGSYPNDDGSSKVYLWAQPSRQALRTNRAHALLGGEAADDSVMDLYGRRRQALESNYLHAITTPGARPVDATWLTHCMRVVLVTENDKALKAV